MHDRFAIRANPDQRAKAGACRREIRHPTGWRLRLSASEAIELAGPQRRLTCLQATFKKSSNLCSAQHRRPAIVSDRKATLDPTANGILVDPERGGGFLDKVSEMDLDAPMIDTAIGHDLRRSLLDQCADVLHPPRRDPRAELDRLGETTGLHATPPSRFADGDRAAGREKID
jgi:hypothetical protein